jgi:hypothetical protein
MAAGSTLAYARGRDVRVRACVGAGTSGGGARAQWRTRVTCSSIGGGAGVAEASGSSARLGSRLATGVVRTFLVSASFLARPLLSPGACGPSGLPIGTRSTVLSRP